MELNDLSYKIIGAAFKVHSALGPGLLESTYETCMVHELGKAGLSVENQKAQPVTYNNVKLGTGYRIDLLVENRIIVEIKSCDKVSPVHVAQLLTYMKLSEKKLGLLINFNVDNLQHGIQRLIL